MTNEKPKTRKIELVAISTAISEETTTTVGIGKDGNAYRYHDHTGKWSPMGCPEVPIKEDEDGKNKAKQ